VNIQKESYYLIKTNMIGEMVRIEMSPRDIERFKMFQQYYSVFNTIVSEVTIMHAAGKSGSITLHVNHEGMIDGIKTDKWVYRRK